MIPRPRKGIVVGCILILGSALSLPAWGSPSRPAAPGKAPLPAILTVVESSAEDIVDYALSRNRAAVVAEAGKLRSAASGPAAVPLTQAGVTPQQVNALKLRAARVAQLARGRSFIAVALAANAVSQLMPDLYAHFRDPVPPTILQLDYFDREAQLHSLAGQPGGVARAITGLGQAWPRVRKKVVVAGGASEAAAYTRHIAAMRRLGPAAGPKVQDEAIRGLELVDELERVFTG